MIARCFWIAINKIFHTNIVSILYVKIGSLFELACKTSSITSLLLLRDLEHDGESMHAQQDRVHFIHSIWIVMYANTN